MFETFFTTKTLHYRPILDMLKINIKTKNSDLELIFGWAENRRNTFPFCPEREFVML